MTYQVIDTQQGNVVIETFDDEREADAVSEMLNTLARRGAQGEYTRAISHFAPYSLRPARFYVEAI